MEALVAKTNRWLNTHVPRLDIDAWRAQSLPVVAGSWRRITEVMWCRRRRYLVTLQVLTTGATLLRIERHGNKDLSAQEKATLKRLRFFAGDDEGGCIDLADTQTGPGIRGVVCQTTIAPLGDGARLWVELKDPEHTFVDDLNRWLRCGQGRSEYELGGQLLVADLRSSPAETRLAITAGNPHLPGELGSLLRSLKLAEVNRPSNSARAYFDDSYGGVTVRYHLKPCAQGAVKLVDETS